MANKTQSQKVLNFFEKHPSGTATTKLFDRRTLSAMANQGKLKKIGHGKYIMKLDHPAKRIIESKEPLKKDEVNNPAHYTDGKIEVIDFIEDKKLGFHLGNAIKYIARAGKKDASKKLQDLKKAEWYLKREIKNMEEGKVTVEREKLDSLALGILGVGFLCAVAKIAGQSVKKTKKNG
jgi:hypothetical protein